MLVWAFICLTSCEKHDGISYYKSKCEAELDGQYLIDQSRFDWGFGTGKTPCLIASEYEARFETRLSTKRGEFPLCYVYINMFVETPWDYLTEPQTIEFIDIADIDEELNSWDYKRYCEDHKINYATISWVGNPKTEIVKEGSFQITEMTELDNNQRIYKGKFSLHSIEGMLKGTFIIY